ncbi:MAG: carbohydrate kinase, partial [Clostridia bacterium]
MYDIIAIGELLIDFAEKGVNENNFPILSANAGGAPSNFLATLSKYDAKTALISKVGDDAFGNLLIKTISDCGIDTKAIIKDPCFFTTLAFVTLDKDGDRSFSFARKPGADTQICIKDIDFSLIDSSKAFHFGTLSLTQNPAKTATKKAVLYAHKQKKLITFDPNLRLMLWDSKSDAKKQILWGLKYADVVKISEEEISFLWGCDAKKGADILLNEFNVSLAMVTCGANGCYLKNKNAFVSVKTIKVSPIDTTGAGDIFGGSAISCILKLQKNPSELNETELLYIANFANTAAALSTERFGGIPSIISKEKVLSQMKANNFNIIKI